MTPDPIIYCDEPGYRVLDLRPDGLACIPVLGMSDFSAVRKGTDFHHHPGCMEFCFCLKGNLIFDTPREEFPFLPGHVFVSAPNQPHHLRNNPSGLKVYRILFRIPVAGETILGLDARGSEWISRALTHLPKRMFAATADVRASFERLFSIFDTHRRRSPSRAVKLRAAALDLLLAIIDSSRRFRPSPVGKIYDLAKRIGDHPAAEYPIEELANEAGLSVSAFTSAFKQAQGLPPHAFMLNCRIGKARQLLLESDRTITAIAQELRFYSPQHFANTFRRIIGVNPNEYRAQSRPAAQATPPATLIRKRRKQ